MTEWMRLGATVGTLVVALGCVVTAGRADQSRSYSSRSCQHAFATAALLLFVCVPVLVLDAAGILGSLGWLALLPLVGGGAVLTGLGRRWTVRSGRRRSLEVTARRSEGHPSPVTVSSAGFVTDEAWESRLAARAATVSVPVMVVTVGDDGQLVELNQN